MISILYLVNFNYLKITDESEDKREGSLVDFKTLWCTSVKNFLEIQVQYPKSEHHLNADSCKKKSRKTVLARSEHPAEAVLTLPHFHQPHKSDLDTIL